MARVTFDLPRLLIRVADGQRHVEVEAQDTRGAIEALLTAHPGLRSHLFDETGALRRNVLCAVDEEPTRLTGELPPIRDGSRIVFVPSVAGGCSVSGDA